LVTSMSVSKEVKSAHNAKLEYTRVEGDNDEDEIDDLENKFNVLGKGNNRHDAQQQYAAVESVFYWHMTYGRFGDTDKPQVLHTMPQLQLLTNGKMGDNILPEHHALVPSFMGGGRGKRIHPLPFSDFTPGLYLYFQLFFCQLQFCSWICEIYFMMRSSTAFRLTFKLLGSAVNCHMYVVQNRSMNPSKDLSAYGYGCVAWKERVETWRQEQEWLIKNEDGDKDWGNDNDGPDLPVYKKKVHPSQPSVVDIFVSTGDPFKKPPLETANTVLSILAVDYPMDKVSCYVSDDGAAMLTFKALSVTSEFTKKWVPLCKSKKFNAEPRAPEFYFAHKLDYLKDKIVPTFVKDRRAMKINMKALNGIQGPIYVGTGCVFRRQDLYRFDAQKTKKPHLLRTSIYFPKWAYCGCYYSGKKKKKKATKAKSTLILFSRRKVAKRDETCG
ncbi:hypothetical protein GIB67_007138, partial [Kingdonia uniflora]